MGRLKQFFRRPKDSTDPSSSSNDATPTETTEHPQGLDVIYEAPNPTVDIVAIHGLNGHREKTWTASNEVHWLRDLLPEDVPQARIFSWGYDVNTHAIGGQQLSNMFLYDHGLTLVSDLTLGRKETKVSSRPL